MNINRRFKIHPMERVSFSTDEPRRPKFHIYDVRWSLFDIKQNFKNMSTRKRLMAL